jgi:hypothetical protein
VEQHTNAAPTLPLLDGRPALAWTTLARAERLAYRGLGWSADHVMRKALNLFEQAYLTGPVIPREELIDTLAGEDLEPTR